MRRSQSSPEHVEAVSRRLATLSAELAGVRGEPSPAPPGVQHTRVRGEREELPPAPVELPVPGRHASRRLSLGALRLGPVHLAVVAVVAAVAVGIAAWLAVADQARPAPVPQVAPVQEPLTSISPPVSPSVAVDEGAEVTVDVAGRVRHPGIAVLASGSRVVDALEAAGGAKRGVDLTSLNLARPLVDGEQILVGVAVPAGVAGTLGTPGETGSLVNINTADQVTLETLPGVGPVTAEAIMAWRTDNGPFSSVDELLEVDGIGEATLADLAPHVTI